MRSLTRIAGGVLLLALALVPRNAHAAITGSIEGTVTDQATLAGKVVSLNPTGSVTYNLYCVSTPGGCASAGGATCTGTPVFHVLRGVAVNFSGLTIAGGGGGLLNEGSASLQDSTISCGDSSRFRRSSVSALTSRCE